MTGTAGPPLDAAPPEPVTAGGAPGDGRPARQPLDARALAWVAGALVAVRVLALVLALLSGPDARESTIGGDARRYDQIATAAGLPYRDHAVEYPPGSVVVIEAVHGPTLLQTQIRLGISQLLCDLGAAAVLAWTFGRRTGVAYLLLGLPFVAFPFLYLRIDLVAVLVAAGALAVLHRRRDRTGDVLGGVLLAVAVLVKIWPGALIPLLLVERRWRALAACAGAGLAMSVAWAAVAGIDGVVQVVTFRGAEGWQVESVAGIFVHMLEPTRVHVESGAWRTGVMPVGSRTLLSVLSVATIVLAWWWAEARGRAGNRSAALRYGLAPAAAVLGLVVWAPIISPQYVLWLLPWAAVVAARGDRTLGWLTFAASALSTVSLATIRAQIEGELYATLPILARNVVLVAMLCHVLVGLAGHRAVADDDEAVTASGSAGT